jgi:hypothetical protein
MLDPLERCGIVLVAGERLPELHGTRSRSSSRKFTIDVPLDGPK